MTELTEEKRAELRKKALRFRWLNMPAPIDGEELLSLLDALDAAESRSPSADEVAGLLDDTSNLRAVASGALTVDTNPEMRRALCGCVDRLEAFIRRAGSR